MAEISPIVPALTALGGVALAQAVSMLQSYLDRKNKRDVLLRTKYEELATYFLDSISLPHSLMLAKNDEDLQSLTLQEFANKAHLLAMIYFPELKHATGQYIESYSSLGLTASTLYNPDDERPLGMQVYDNPDYRNVADTHKKARDYLQNKIEEHSVKYAKS